jgi:hypothetical protein
LIPTTQTTAKQPYQVSKGNKPISALQWLPSALRSGLMALAAFSPLVAYNAGACF